MEKQEENSAASVFLEALITNIGGFIAKVWSNSFNELMYTVHVGAYHHTKAIYDLLSKIP